MSAVKTFVLVLSLIAPDGSTTDVPVDLWKFTSMPECAKSTTYLNKGAHAATRNYVCVEYDPSKAVAAAKIQPPPRTKRNS